MKDLFILAADETMKACLQELLKRHQSLGIDTLTDRCQIIAHPYRDGGVLNGAADFLAPLQNLYRYAIAICDRDGCGRETSRTSVEGEIEEKLSANGWDGRSAAIVIEPELEIWLWQQSPHVAKALGWSHDSLWDWMIQERYCSPETGWKPRDPKGCARRAARIKRRPWTSAIHSEIASSVSLVHCQDAAFTKLRQTLQAWFPKRLT